MLVETHEIGEIRKYLLGYIQAEDERRKIEERLMLNDDYFEQISMQEEELIQDYADGQLNPDERRRFEKHFFISEERRQKIKFAMALRRYINERQFPKNEDDNCKRSG
jgi:anti-sigma-K factor RskA